MIYNVIGSLLNIADAGGGDARVGKDAWLRREDRRRARARTSARLLRPTGTRHQTVIFLLYSII